MLRALPLLAMLGFRKVEVFGWDSCLEGDQHHAYDQPENECKSVVTMKVGGREFKCHPWMSVQAHEVQRVIRHILGRIDTFQMKVHGDGLIAHILQTAAAAAEEN